MSNKKLTTKVVIALLIVAGAVVVWFYYNSTKDPAIPPKAVYETDTTLTGAQSVGAGERVVVKNGSTLTINGDYTVNGLVDCDNGPIRLVVTGALAVNGKITCVRAADLSDSDQGIGIAIVASGDVTFSKEATVATNGHMQIVDDKVKLAVTSDALNKIFDSVGDDSGKKFRVGPFIEIPLAPGQKVSRAGDFNITPALPGRLNEPTGSSLIALLATPAQAQEPAVDATGNPVAGTIKIGGTWVIGSPSTPPPAELQIPVPPKKIKKIILDFDFGNGHPMVVQDFTLYGPDGQTGTDDTGKCVVRSGNGNDAMRLNINAPSVEINNFNLYLGYGGDGGFAETSNDCDPGVATGGRGGEPGNLKITSDDRINIIGAFNIHPGQGGRGGQAVAHGKNGEAACPGVKGGDATATGGQGGDNKKGLRVTGNVSGTTNVSIDKIVAGNGGSADATGGQGGDGNACGCTGGQGGKATATGGKGGTATSRTAESQGGDGGDANAIPGIGGNGGSCDATKKGGNGGKGGDAIAKEGKLGTGKTANGQDGTIQNQTGGTGGNGGDGCPEGKGGAGGNGKPNGENGQDGKNLCVPINTNTNTSIDPGTNTAPPSEPVNVTPGAVTKEHTVGITACPTPLGTISIKGPAGGSWTASGVPGWLQMPRSGKFPAEIPIAFNCQISVYSSHAEKASVNIAGTTASGQAVTSASLNVTVNIIGQ